MGWGSVQAQAVFETLDGAFVGDAVAVAVTAVDARGAAFSRSAGLPEDARFEIGSITKTMTAALLASLVGDAVLALDDEIGRWLDGGPNASITLEQHGPRRCLTASSPRSTGTSAQRVRPG